MIIGVDIAVIGERNSGTSRYIQCLLSQLETTGHDIRVFPSHPLKHLPLNSWLSSIPVLKRGGIVRHWYRLFQQTGEMTMAGVDAGIFPNYLMPLDFRRRSLIIIHDLSFFSHPEFYSKAFSLFYKDQLRRILRTNPLIATVSEYSRQSIEKYLGVKAENIFLLQPYVDPETFIKRAYEPLVTEEVPYFLYVGHIEPRKNLGFLIRNFLAWKHETGRNVRLKIVGDLWLKSAEIRELLHRYARHPDVEFTGYVDEDRLHELYSNAAAFVHTSLMEGFGFPVLEAMEYGLPVLCSSGTSTEEISHPHSIVVDPHDDAGLVAGLNRLYARTFDPAPPPDTPYSPRLMRQQLEALVDALGARKLWPVRTLPQIEVETAIQRTLLYYKLFNSGLTLDKLHQYLLDIRVTKPQVDAAIDSLIAAKTISLSNGVLFLNADIASFYRRKTTRLKSTLTLRLLWMLKRLPFITAIAFSGGTANYGLNDHDDIDLFIVTKPFTVYLVYLMIHALSLVFRSRRILCINYLVDEHAAEIDIQRDLYTAHQIIALQSFKNDTYLRHFFGKNSWIGEHFPNYHIPDEPYPESSLVYRIFRPLNNAIGKLYQWRYRHMRTITAENSIVLSEHIVKLHTKDYRATVLHEFDAQWATYLRTARGLSIASSLSSSLAK